jgi:Flp pilus assembly protein TadD
MIQQRTFQRILGYLLVVGMVFLMIHFFLLSSAKPVENAQLQRPLPSFPLLSKEELVSSHSGKSSEFIPLEAQRAAAEGNTAFSRGDFRQAVGAYQEVVQLLPNNLVGLVNLAVAQYRAGDIPSAEKNLKRALSLRLETGVAWLTLGTAYMDQNRLDEALAALVQARLYDPQNAHVHNYLGVVMNRIGWSDAAESELRTAVELDTAYSDAHYNLAIVYMDRTPPAVELAKRHYYLALQHGARRDAHMETYFKNSTALLENSP